ncbi:hypothetical protein AHAS_Ahas11G0121800 [Arachis hypogaea]
MFVTEYTREFKNLCLFSKTCQRNPADYEEWICSQYERRLRRDIFNYIYPQRIRSLIEMVNKSQFAEDCSMKWALLQEGYGETTPNEPHKAGLGLCFRCGVLGHMSRDFPRGRAIGAGWLQQD